MCTRAQHLCPQGPGSSQDLMLTESEEASSPSFSPLASNLRQHVSSTGHIRCHDTSLASSRRLWTVSWTRLMSCFAICPLPPFTQVPLQLRSLFSTLSFLHTIFKRTAAHALQVTSTLSPSSHPTVPHTPSGSISRHFYYSRHKYPKKSGES